MNQAYFILDKTGTKIILDGWVPQDVYDNVVRAPGPRAWQKGRLFLQATWETLSYVKTHVPTVGWDPTVQDVYDRLQRLNTTAKNTRALKRHPPQDVGTYKPKTAFFDHQKQAFALSKDAPVFALFMEMGTGKTKVVLDTAAYLYARGEVDLLLVVAPNGVHRQWIEEQVPLHMPDHVSVSTYLYTAATFDRLFDPLKDLATFEGLVIVAMNTESFSSDKGVKFASWWLTHRRALFVVDESSRIKTPGAKRTKTLLHLSTLAPYRRILSGAPVTKGVEDLYSQLRFLDVNILGFSNFYSFRSRYCQLGGWQNKQVVGYRNTEELQERLVDWSYRIRKDECLSLPEKVYTRLTVELTSEQRRLYKQLKDEFLLELEGGTMEAPLAITRLMKLQQITCGHLKAEFGSSDIPSDRASAVVDHVEETDGKVIVWGRFRRDLDLVAAEVHKRGHKYIIYDGRTTGAERGRLLTSFLKDPEVKFFIGQPQAGGLGLNLTVATCVVYYSNDFNAETRWQSEDRAHRIGQKHHVTYVDVLSPGTMDAKVLSALQRKQNVANLIVDNQGIKELLND
jgi:SNF2 family DNA or RNA helicase